MKKWKAGLRIAFVLVAPLVISALLHAQMVMMDHDGPRVKTLEIHADNTVTFRLYSPKASTVTLSCDWPEGINSTVVPRVKDDQGVWSATIGQMQPDVWFYFFTVDGAHVIDDGNSHTGFDGAYFSEFVVPGPGAETFYVHDVPHGTVSEVWYPAPSIGQERRRAIVYTPPGYETSKDRYPVLYLLDNDEMVWMRRGRAAIILDNLIASGKAKPMIVAIADGGYKDPASSDYLDVELPSTKDRLMGGTGQVSAPKIDNPLGVKLFQGGGGGELDETRLRVGQSVAKDLVPFIDQRYRTIADRYHRATLGASSPGAEIFYGAMTNVKTFAWIGIIAGGFPTLPGVGQWGKIPDNYAQFFAGPDLVRTVDPAKLAALLPDMNPSANLRMLYLAVGKNDSLWNTQQTVKQLLDQKGMKYTAREIDGYHHAWRFFRWGLNDYAQLLFQEAK